MKNIELKEMLEALVEKYNNPSFIEEDPISIPHRYTDSRDIEISGLFSAILSWGQRKTIINKSKELMLLMDDAPYSFVIDHGPRDKSRFANFVHRTFQGIDAQYFLAFLQDTYKDYDSLERVFYPDPSVPYDQETALNQFYHKFRATKGLPIRTTKHVAAPLKNGTCKRLNMFLRWMVRSDKCGVDFGIWKRIPMSALKIPLDVHVEKYARELHLLRRTQRDWKAVLELTDSLINLDPLDPVRYDYALFSLGAIVGR
jgi:uncharacterized protein (TIGR02757 family)